MPQEDKQRKDRLLAKARGQALPEGVTGQLPLPPAKAVSVQPAKSREAQQQAAQRGQRARPMTPTERKALESIGWDPTQPVPSNTADILAKLVAERENELQNLPPPVDPRTPKLNVEVRELGALSEAEKARARQILAEAAQREVADRQEQARRQAVQQRPDGVRHVIEQLEVLDDVTPKAAPSPRPAAPSQPRQPAAPQSRQPMSWDARVEAYKQAYTAWHGRNLPLIQAGMPTEPPPSPPQMTPDEHQAHYEAAAAHAPTVDLGLSAPNPQPQARATWVPDASYVPVSDEELEAQAEALQEESEETPPMAPEAESPEEESAERPAPEGTGADVPMAECPHCRWPLHLEDIPEPSHHEKMAFLGAVLSGKPYMHEHVAMGGILRLTFRTLTLAEIDAVHAQAHRDAQEGRAATKLDFYERINRYRLYLQLQSMRVEYKGSSEPPVVHEQPHGLDPETNGRAASYWSTRFEKVDGNSILPFVEMAVTSTLLPTEHMFRVAMQACERFNRTVSKLEALVDNSDFWNAIAPQS